MNLREEILKEHSKKQALKIANYACQSSRQFKELMNCFLDDEYRLAQRAAWSVSWAVRQGPQMIGPHIRDLVSAWHKTHVHAAVVRNSIRVLQEIDIPENFHGEVMDTCFKFLEEPLTPIAIKVFSLTTLFNLSKVYPEIKPELKLIIEDNIEHGTAAFRARAKRILPKL